MKERRRTSGVSLVEMLAALAVLSLISVAVSSILFQAGQLDLRAQRTAASLEVSANRMVLQRRAARILPAERVPGGSIIGESNSVRAVFAPDFEDEFLPSSAASLSVYLDAGEREAIVTLEGDDRTEGQPKSVSLVLAVRVDELSISYWSASSGWKSSWSERSAKPKLIWIEFFSKGDERPSPIALRPGLHFDQRTISLSDLVPPGRPSAP